MSELLSTALRGEMANSQAPIVEIDISGTDATAPAANSRGK